MAVSEDDVRHVAALARLGIEDSRIPALVRELNGILDHMEELECVESGTPDLAVVPPPTVVRSDGYEPSVPLATPREAFAPEMRDGFFLVPRLATHEGEGERSP